MGLLIAGARLDDQTVGLRCDVGVIAAVGPDVEPEPGDEVIDGAGMALVPGLINAHTHAGMTLFRGYADDRPLMEWLTEYIWPVEKRMSDDDVAVAELLARTGAWARGEGDEPYPLAQACQDHAISLAMAESARAHADVRVGGEPWS